MIIWPSKSLMIWMNTVINLSVSYYPSQKQASKSDIVIIWMIRAQTWIELTWTRMIKNEICSIWWNPSVICYVQQCLSYYILASIECKISTWMAAAVHHSTLDLPLFVLLHAHPNLGSGCSIKALQVQLYVLLEYFNRAFFAYKCAGFTDLGQQRFYCTTHKLCILDQWKATQNSEK